MKKDLLKAIELALAGQWDGAHNIVQQAEGDATASWIHAVLHKIEGDLDNSRYWYRRAAKMDHVSDESRAELEQIRKELQTSVAAKSSAA
jgi:hypothetical protein